MPDRPVVVATYTALYEAEIAQGRLEEQGIDAFVSRDGSGGVDPDLQLTRGVRLLVRQREAEEALGVLQETSALPARRDEDPAADWATPGKMWRQFGAAALIMGPLILILGAAVAAWEASELGIAFWMGAALVGAGVLARLQGARAKRRKGHPEKRKLS
jgi:hypothetical protein